MKKIIRNVFCLIFTDIKFLLIKLFHFSKFKFNLINICSPSSGIDITGGEIQLGNRFKMRSNCHINSRREAKLIIGNNVFLNYGTIIVAHEMIMIGDNCQIAPNVLIYDHDHDYRDGKGITGMKYNSSPVIIGKNVWIGANTIILRGSIIGDNCVIAAGSVVKGNVASNSLFLQTKNDKIMKINKKKKEE